MLSLGLGPSCCQRSPMAGQAPFWLQLDPFQDFSGFLLNLRAFLWFPFCALGGETSFETCCGKSFHVLD